MITIVKNAGMNCFIKQGKNDSVLYAEEKVMALKKKQALWSTFFVIMLIMVIPLGMVLMRYFSVTVTLILVVVAITFFFAITAFSTWRKK